MSSFKLQIALTKSPAVSIFVITSKLHQREKARLCAARNRARKHTVDNDATTHSPTPTSAGGASQDTEPNLHLHPLAHLEIPPPEKVRQLIADWKSEWGMESTWPKKFHEQLKYAQGWG
ncbi:hypothetical protein F5141DRAFT_1067001 [Pisolithus sp. B1]|nr:hypothetical protein F5141DRAFT_1067001 [Pisolithus sp. B1]